ncbi:MAG: OmpA family protein [Bacteroidales bacterium]|jgi:outer membrane protein OmpA-like peptidoglycan-associated protein/tetratricopeptide (TPR) repeat protein|nr:OmpA family protein [Bacteroidales bacterium]
MIRKSFFVAVSIVFCGSLCAAAPIVSGSSSALSVEKTLAETDKLPPMARTRVKQGDAAAVREAYAEAYDKYLRALSFTKDTALQPLVYYKIGQSQLYLNHHKNAYDYFRMVWDKGYRDFQFLKEYAGVLLVVGRLNDFDKVVAAIQKRGIKDTLVNVLIASANLVRATKNNSTAAPISMGDIHPLSSLNTPFTDYGMGLLNDQMVFSSSRFIQGSKLEIDPGIGQAYSRLFSATYDKEQKTWVNPTPLKGQFPMVGNVGTFSFDASKNIAYFMWSMENKNGIYTLQQLGGGVWTNLTEFQPNYLLGGTTFGGNIGHPSISPDGNRLLFTVKDLDRGTGTDIWIVEKTQHAAGKSSKKPTKISTPKQRAKSAQKTKAQAPKVSKPKKGSKEQPKVILDKDWDIPYRFGSAINTPQTEVFPQWVDNYTFVYSSNGKIGFGGLDMYMVKLDKDHKTVKSVEHLPAPINSSFDDHSFLYDDNHKSVLFSSNRPTKYGVTDNLYVFDKAGAVIRISGTAYDTATGVVLAPYTVILNGDTLLPDYQGVYSKGGLSAGIFVLTASSAGYVSKTDTLYLDSVSSILPVVVQHEKNFYLAKEKLVEKSTFITREQKGATPVSKRPKPVTQPATSDNYGYVQSSSYDTLPTYIMSDDYSEPVAYVPSESSVERTDAPATYVPSYNSTEQTVSYVPSDNSTERTDAPATYVPSDNYSAPATGQTVSSVPSSSYSTPHTNEPSSITQRSAIANPDQMPVRQPVQPQDLTKHTNDDMSAKQLVEAITKNRKDVPTADQRAIDDYKRRVNDPLRRSTLRVLPSGTECEACSETVKRRNVGEPFYVNSGDDKTLITLINNANQRTFLDLTPNTNYGIDVTTIDAKGEMSSLPKNIDIKDVRKTVVTKDYIVYECAPKLSELNDETYVNNLYFDFGRDSLIKDASRELDRMIIIALKNPNIQVEVSAYADERGSDEYNKNLTDRRLSRALSYLERKGFDTDRIKGKSYGKSNPLIVNAATEDEHRLNRRVTFKLLFPFAKNVKVSDATYPVSEDLLTVTKGLIFRIQVGAFTVPLEAPFNYYKDVLRIDPTFEISYYRDKDGLYKYNVGGDYTDLDVARKIVRTLLDNGRECYVAAFYNGDRITVKEAIVIMKRNR